MKVCFLFKKKKLFLDNKNSKKNIMFKRFFVILYYMDQLFDIYVYNSYIDLSNFNILLLLI